MWNLDNISGEWYNVDTTTSDIDDAGRYLFLNVTDAALKPHYLWDADFSFNDFGESEVINAFNFKLPAATSNKYNYLSLAGRMIELTDISVIDSKVLEAYENGKNKCEFAFTDSTQYTYESETIVNTISFPECVSQLALKNPNLSFSISGIPGTRGFVILWN